VILSSSELEEQPIKAKRTIRITDFVMKFFIWMFGNSCPEEFLDWLENQKRGTNSVSAIRYRQTPTQQDKRSPRQSVNVHLLNLC
jgi:hypothetical protein